ncbi:MAG: hypothetical protein ABFC31_07200 [Clostridiaceae bacterium]
MIKDIHPHKSVKPWKTTPPPVPSACCIEPKDESKPIELLYLCDAQLNNSCTKTRCALRGGTCCTTSEVEFALRDRGGKPAVVTPFLQLKARS